MRKFLYPFIFSLGIANAGYSQNLKVFIKNAVKNNQITFTYGDSTAVIHLLDTEAKTKFRPREDRIYNWYSSNQLKATAGGYAGRLLDGPYTLFSRNKNLLEKGQLKKGLKDGKWIRWFENGAIHRVENWKEGVKNGTAKEYDEQGKLLRQAYYKGGLKEGTELVADDKGAMKVYIYRRGQLKTNKKESKPGNTNAVNPRLNEGLYKLHPSNWFPRLKVKRKEKLKTDAGK